MRRTVGSREGSMLFEMILGLTVLLMSVLAYVGSMSVSFRSHQENSDFDQAEIAVQNVAEFLRGQDPSTVYSEYHNTFVDVVALHGPGGQPATISITCLIDETKIPSDLALATDFDGVVGTDSADVTASYRLLPVRLTAAWIAAGESRVLERFLLLGGYSDVKPEERDPNKTGVQRIQIGIEDFDAVISKHSLTDPSTSTSTTTTDVAPLK